MYKLAAISVHIYTALGAVIAFLIIIAAVHNQTIWFLWLTLLSMIIDATDGMLARKFKVKKYTPGFDGATLDNIVDYLTYVFAPTLFLWSQNFIPNNLWGMCIVALILLSSCYQFCRVDAKTDNQNYYFLGFPDYWNIIAFYALIATWNQMFVENILILCSIAIFIPIKYLYPSRTTQWKKITIPFTALWFICSILILVPNPIPKSILLTISYSYIIYYILMSFYFTLITTKKR